MLLGALTVTSHATVTTQIGDLILGFRETDNTVALNLEIDLGPASNFLSLAPGTVVNLNYGGAFYGTTGGLAPQDLRNIYGTGGTDDSAWNADPGLKFSVFGTTGAAGSNTLYITSAPGTTLPRSTSSGQSGTAGRINTVSGSLNGSVALVSPEAASIDSTTAGSYSVQYRGGNPGTLTLDWNHFNAITETAVSSGGSATASLNQLTAGSGPGQALGQFTLGSDGTLTYAAVPEPASGAMVLAGTALLVFQRRRRSA